MQAFTCTVLFAISSVAFASHEPDANPGNEDAGNEQIEEGSEEGTAEDDEAGSAEDEEPGGPGDAVEDVTDPHDEDEDSGTDPGVEDDVEDFEEDVEDPDEDPIPDLDEDADEGDEDEAPDLSDDDPSDELVEWQGQARLVAVVSGERLVGWEVAGVRRHIPVAIYALEDDSMLGDVSSVYVTWEGSFSSFGPSAIEGDSLIQVGDRMQVIVTTEAYAAGIADMMDVEEAPESAFIVQREYLAADVHSEYGVVLAESDSEGFDTRRSFVPGWQVAEAPHPTLDFLVGYPDHTSSTGVYFSHEPVEGGLFMDLGEGWEDETAWYWNAPEYAFDGVGPGQDPHHDDGPPPEDEPRPDRDRDRDRDSDSDPEPDPELEPIEDEDPDAGDDPWLNEEGPDLSTHDPVLGNFPGF